MSRGLRACGSSRTVLRLALCGRIEVNSLRDKIRLVEERRGDMERQHTESICGK